MNVAKLPSAHESRPMQTSEYILAGALVADASETHRRTTDNKFYCCLYRFCLLTEDLLLSELSETRNCQ